MNAPESRAPADQAVAVPDKTQIKVLAFALWIVVGSLLTYGITQTAIKAAQLFTA